MTNKVALGTVGLFQSGFGFPKKFQGLTSGDYPFAKVGDISRAARRGHDYLAGADNYVNAPDLPQLKAKLIPKGAILFAKIGEAIRQNFRAISGCEMLIDNNAMAFIPNIGIVDERFVFHYLRTVDFYAIASATTVPALRKSTLERIELPLPPLPEQRRIAAILDKADAIRRKRQQAIELTEKFLKSAFLEMFGDPVTNPKGWESKTIGDIAEVSTGKTPSRSQSTYYNGTVPWVKTTEVDWGIISSTEENITDLAFTKCSMRMFPVGSILVALYGQGKTRGKSALLGVSATTNQACGVILPSDSYATEYMRVFLMLSYAELRGKGRGGNQPNLNLNIIRSFPIPLPPMKIQLQFTRLANKHFLALKKQNAASIACGQLFNGLVQRAFRGELSAAEVT